MTCVRLMVYSYLLGTYKPLSIYLFSTGSAIACIIYRHYMCVIAHTHTTHTHTTHTQDKILPRNKLWQLFFGKKCQHLIHNTLLPITMQHFALFCRI